MTLDPNLPTGITAFSALKSAHELMKSAFTHTFHKAVCVLLLKATEIKLPQRRMLNQWQHKHKTRKVFSFIHDSFQESPPSEANPCWTNLVNNRTGSLLVDPRTLNRVDTDHQHSGLWVFCSAARWSRVDTHIAEHVPALRRGGSPRGRRDLTHRGSQMRSSHGRGIL